jgi:hypothetical protein
MITICGTGSRDLAVAKPEVRRSVYDWVVSWLDELAALDKVLVLSGMAEGFDECVAVAASRMGLRWEAAIPHRNYASHYWGRVSVTGRDRSGAFAGLAGGAARRHIISPSVYIYTSDGRRVHSNFARNTWMLERSDVVLAYPTGSPGTRHGLEEAARLERDVKVYPEGRG